MSCNFVLFRLNFTPVWADKQAVILWAVFWKLFLGAYLISLHVWLKPLILTRSIVKSKMQTIICLLLLNWVAHFASLPDAHGHELKEILSLVSIIIFLGKEKKSCCSCWDASPSNCKIFRRQKWHFVYSFRDPDPCTLVADNNMLYSPVSLRCCDLLWLSVSCLVLARRSPVFHNARWRGFLD